MKTYVTLKISRHGMNNKEGNNPPFFIGSSTKVNLMYYNNMFKERIILKRKNISFGYIHSIYPHNIFQRKDIKIFLAIAKDTHI